MSNHELCPTCQPKGYCLFEKIANRVAEEVPPLEQHKPIRQGENQTWEASYAHGQIEKHRTIARDHLNCPNVNAVNPNYPGKNNL